MGGPRCARSFPPTFPRVPLRAVTDCNRSRTSRPTGTGSDASRSKPSQRPGTAGRLSYAPDKWPRRPAPGSGIGTRSVSNAGYRVLPRAERRVWHLRDDVTPRAPIRGRPRLAPADLHVDAVPAVMRRPRRSLVRVIATVLAMDRRPSASRHDITSFRCYHTCIELPRQRWESDKRYNPSGPRWTRDVLAVIPAANAAPRGLLSSTEYVPAR